MENGQRKRESSNGATRDSADKNPQSKKNDIESSKRSERDSLMGRRHQYQLGILLLVMQVILIVLFAIFAEYTEEADARHEANRKDPEHGGNDPLVNSFNEAYPLFQDVHVMIFFGIAFLLTFMKRYGYSSTGFNMLIGVFAAQWGILFSGFLHLHHGKIIINVQSLMAADFTAATVLITFCVLLGKVSPLQLIVLAFIEVMAFAVNEWIGLSLLQVVDIGGSMFVHVFAAYFGLACARVLYSKDIFKSTKAGPVYHSDIFSIAGTLFLWIYWPSFNGALASGDGRYRAVINTYLAMASCCMTTFAVSHLVNKGRFEMEHIQNATLAGGVAAGASADLMIHPWGGALLGTLAGIISTLGFKYGSNLLASKLKTHDSCGVHNLHGLPGILAGLACAIYTYLADTDTYGYSLYKIYPARAPLANTTELADIQAHFADVGPGLNRSATDQALYQLAALGITILFSLVAGAITGFILKIDIWGRPRGAALFDDGPWWETPDDFRTSNIFTNGSHKLDTLMEEAEPENGHMMEHVRL